MRILKPLFRILVVVLVLGAVGLGVLYYLSGRAPSRYRPSALTAEQIAEAATRVDTQKMPGLVSYANKAHAYASAAQLAEAQGRPTPAAATRPIEPLTVSFTQDEINSSLIKWSERYHDTLKKYVTQPYVVIEDQQLILMGTVPELGRVVSMYLEPRIDEQGLLRCDADNVYLGSLPLPSSMFSTYRAKLENALKVRMPRWRQSARLDPGGAANSDARALVLARLVLQMLSQEPGPAVLFLPRVNEKSRGAQESASTVPVRLKDVTLEKGALTITVQPMDASDHAALAEQIQTPHQSASTSLPPQN